MRALVETKIKGLRLRFAEAKDVEVIRDFIHALAVYEHLETEMKASSAQLTETLFGVKPYAEVILAEIEGKAVGFALFFHNYSTFLGKPGIYLEDLFVLPEVRGEGIGTALLCYIAKIALERGCGRFEWSVLDWNEPAIKIYQSMGAESLNEWIGQRVTGDVLERLAERFSNEFEKG